MKDWSADERAAIEVNLRSMSWKQLTQRLKTAVEENHRPIELPPMIRRWLEVNRAEPRTEEEAVHIAREVRAIQWWADTQGDSARWFQDKTETVPISRWIVEAAHILRDGKRWWHFAAQRHDDKASLVGPTVPAPATKIDLKKLGKIIAYAGGDPKRELFRTGAITQEEHDEFVAADKPGIAEYGQIFFWWRA